MKDEEQVKENTQHQSLTSKCMHTDVHVCTHLSIREYNIHKTRAK